MAAVDSIPPPAWYVHSRPGDVERSEAATPVSCGSPRKLGHVDASARCAAGGDAVAAAARTPPRAPRVTLSAARDRSVCQLIQPQQVGLRDGAWIEARRPLLRRIPRQGRQL